MFSQEAVAMIDRSSKLSVAFDGTKYLPGIVGLNNIKVWFISALLLYHHASCTANVLQANDYMNVILHTLAHVSPFRDYFLRELNYSHIKPPPGDQMFILGKHNIIV